MTQDINKRDFRGLWIPREIWFHPDLSITDKTIWAEIYSLHDRERGGCYATNEYLAKFFGCSERNIRISLERLRKHGLLIDVSFNGRQRVVRALQPPQDDGLYSDIYEETGRKLPPSMEENFHPNRKKTSTLSYNIEQSIYHKREDIAKNPGSERIISQKETATPKPAKPARSASEEASLLLDFYISELEKEFPKVKKIQASEANKLHFQELLDRKDPKGNKSFSFQEIKNLISYGFREFWAPDNINSVAKFKKNIDRVYMAMHKKRSISPSKSINTPELNRKKFREWLEDNKERCIEKDINPYETHNYVLCGNKSIYFNSPTFLQDVNKLLE